MCRVEAGNRFWSIFFNISDFLKLPSDRLTPSEKEEDRGAPGSVTVVLKREFQQVSFVYMENLGEIPSSSQQLKMQEPCPLGQGSCSFMKRGFHQGLHE